MLEGRESSPPEDGATSADVPELVPVRMLNEHCYCPRLFYLEWVQGEFRDSADTVDGRIQHARVDKPGQRTKRRRSRKEPEPAPDEPVTIHARSVELSGPEVGLITRMDLLETDGRRATPIDYKRGKKPDIPEGAWEPERVQLCAQGLILRENGFESTEGILYFVESKERTLVPFDDALVARTLELLSDLRTTAAAGQIPPPLVDSPKCPRCSLVSICLPDEVHLLDELGLSGDALGSEERDDYALTVPDVQPDPGDSALAPRTVSATAASATEPPPVRRLVPARDDALPLYVQTPGARIAKKGDRLRIETPDDDPQEVRLVETSQVVLCGPVQISTQTIHELMSRSIPVCYLSSGAWFVGLTTGHGHKNVEVRIAQHRAAANPERSLALARRLVVAKIKNSRTLIRRNHPDAPVDLLDELDGHARRAGRAERIESLLGIEGSAARAYFSALPHLIRPPDASATAPLDDVDAALATFEANVNPGAVDPASHQELESPAPSRHSAAPPVDTDAPTVLPRAPQPGLPSGADADPTAPGPGPLPPARLDAFTFDFTGRNRRPPRDPVNAMLSLLYAVLTKDLTVAVHSVGLDPYVGFLHRPRFGRPALALDLMEEFRPLIADSVVLTAINTGVVRPTDFISRLGAVALRPHARRALLQAYERRLDQLVTHPVFGYRISYRRVFEVQARLLTRHLLGELPTFPPFLTR